MFMTAAKVIEEMDGLPQDEQAKVIVHAFEQAAIGNLAQMNCSNWPVGWRHPTTR
jgi:hypothetical protein